MGITVILLGSILGFFGGLGGWLFLDLSLLAAVALWIASGPASVLLLLLPQSLVPARIRAQTA